MILFRTKIYFFPVRHLTKGIKFFLNLQTRGGWDIVSHSGIHSNLLVSLEGAGEKIKGHCGSFSSCDTFACKKKKSESRIANGKTPSPFSSASGTPHQIQRWNHWIVGEKVKRAKFGAIWRWNSMCNAHGPNFKASGTPIDIRVGCDASEAHWALNQRLGNQKQASTVRTDFRCNIFRPLWRNRKSMASLNFAGSSGASLWITWSGQVTVRFATRPKTGNMCP